MMTLVTCEDPHQLDGVQIDVVHVRAARNRLFFSSNFRDRVRRAKAPLAVRNILVAEKILSDSGKIKRFELNLKDTLPSGAMHTLLFLALAHRSWATIRNALAAIGATDSRVTALKKAYKIFSRTAIQGERLCIFCAPSSTGTVTGQLSRMSDNVLGTLKAKGLRCGDNVIALRADGRAGHFRIDEQTQFGDIASRGRADLRLSAKRRRARF